MPYSTGSLMNVSAGRSGNTGDLEKGSGLTPAGRKLLCWLWVSLFDDRYIYVSEVGPDDGMRDLTPSRV